MIPFQVVSLPAISCAEKPCPWKCFRKTRSTRSKLKKPMPHRPTTPENASSMPTMVLCRHRGSPKSSASEPSLCARLGRPPALALPP